MADAPVFARVHVLVVCDEVEEVSEGVYDLRGVRTGLSAASFPYPSHRLCIYLQVSGPEAVVVGRLVAVGESTEEEVVHLPLQSIRLLGPLSLVPIWVEILDCVFPEPGIYWFQVFINDKLVCERRFHVEASPDHGNGQAT